MYTPAQVLVFFQSRINYLKQASVQHRFPPQSSYYQNIIAQYQQALDSASRNSPHGLELLSRLETQFRFPTATWGFSPEGCAAEVEAITRFKSNPASYRQ